MSFVASRSALGRRRLPLAPRWALLAAAAGLAATAAPAQAANVRSAGDFNGDGRADLAIGAPADSIAGFANVGSVNVLYGGDAGLSGARDQQLTTGERAVAGVPMASAVFGTALAAGDFDGDGYGDLAVGAPGQKLNPYPGAPTAGRVLLFYGSKTGLGVRPTSAAFNQGSDGVEGSRRRVIASVRPSRQATSTATAATTWPSAARGMASMAWSVQEQSTSSTAAHGA